MTRAGFSDLLEELAHNWRSKNYTAVADCFSEDVAYADPTRYTLNSRRELLDFFEDDDGMSQDVELHLALFDEVRQMGAVEYTYRGTHVYHGVALLKLDRELISHWREYQHVSTVDWNGFVGRTRF